MRIRRLVMTALVAVIVGAGATGAAIASANGSHSASPAGHAAAKKKTKKKAPKEKANVSGTIDLKSTTYGKILVDSKGDTVYMWIKDKKGSKKTACNTACLAVWPLVTVSGTPKAGTGVKQSLLGTFKVGSKTEVTYNGWPLYTFVSDTKPGDITGQDNSSFGGPWYVLSASGTPITKKPKSNVVEGEA